MPHVKVKEHNALKQALKQGLVRRILRSVKEHNALKQALKRYIEVMNQKDDIVKEHNALKQALKQDVKEIKYKYYI